jgi:hypothetical protein
MGNAYSCHRKTKVPKKYGFWINEIAGNMINDRKSLVKLSPGMQMMIGYQKKLGSSDLIQRNASRKAERSVMHLLQRSSIYGVQFAFKAFYFPFKLVCFFQRLLTQAEDHLILFDLHLAEGFIVTHHLIEPN